MSTSTQPRQPSGTPVGGQFAGKTNPESDTGLLDMDLSGLAVPGPGYRTNADGSLACPHRDLSCCPTCAKHLGVVEVMGAHYFVPDADEREALLASIDDLDDTGSADDARHPTYTTPSGVEVTLWGTGATSRFFDGHGVSVGPEHRDLASATAFAEHNGWRRTGRPPCPPESGGS